MENRTLARQSAYILFFVALAVIAVIMLIPFVWMLSLAFRSNFEIISREVSILPKHVSLDGFRAAWDKIGTIMIWFKNSVMITGIVLTGSLFTSSLAGYIFAKFRFRGRSFLFILILAGLMVPFQITMIPVYLIMKELHLINNLLAVILPSVVSPFGIFLCKQYIELIPSDMTEAAQIDGAGEFYTFFKLIIPQIVPALSALAIFNFIASWNDYLWPLIVLSGEERMTLPLALGMFATSRAVNYNATMAVAFFIMIPSLVIFLTFQRQFMKGAALSDMK
ncbi:carbohydrate ABC transporter permease [Paenibacillus montanisoli]|uniref:Carbohydrate ABC transporter permease n=1 Tax=Paenibacillus montanisoli TaxID=2081970 RepID=A0A328U1L9_9BACL|nr:carbohydrate ABC transporter permease [Paenibacillus montanisoli]RAP74785.1 carbohydrate ABC transporter permease [Paenibacillus montanisoli]